MMAGVLRKGKSIVKKTWAKLRYLDKLRGRKKSEKSAFYIFMAPNHLNLGDVAIMEATKAFAAEHFPDYEQVLFDLDESDAIDSRMANAVRPDDIITILGGGFIGTLWLDEEIVIRKILRVLADKSVVILPQTVFFSDDAKGRRELETSRKIYEGAQRLTVCVREKYSFQFMREHMPNIQTCLIPDMVLSYRYSPPAETTVNEALIVLRSDSEKTTDYKPDVECALRKLGMNWRHTDTVLKKRRFEPVLRYEAGQMAEDKLREFAKASLVITDRLHGMVFAALVNAPCVVLSSASYKIQGVYEWLQHFPFVAYLDDIDRLEDAIRNVRAHDRRGHGEFVQIRREFPEFFDKLERILSDGKNI